MNVTVDNLTNAIEFDYVFRVNEDSTITFMEDMYAPGVYEDESDVIIEDSTWEVLSGYTQQYGYHGPVMHPSEQLGGRLARDILDNPAYYAIVEVYDMGTSGEDVIGWVVVSRPI